MKWTQSMSCFGQLAVSVFFFFGGGGGSGEFTVPLQLGFDPASRFFLVLMMWRWIIL